MQNAIPTVRHQLQNKQVFASMPDGTNSTTTNYDKQI